MTTVNNDRKLVILHLIEFKFLFCFETKISIKYSNVCI